MDRKEEYHDPDYPGTLVEVKEEAPSISEDDKLEKIRHIVRREFTNDLESRENDIMLLDQRSLMARRLLQRLRYVLVNNYYSDERLKLTPGQIQDEVAVQSEPRARTAVSGVLREGQRRLHPSVRKLLGKQSSPVELHEILVRSRAPRNKSRKNYSAMVQSRNYTIAAEANKSLRPPAAEPSTSKLIKVPRRIYPKVTNVVTLDEANRNQTKYRYRIIIGNTSKYAPPASSADRSTHKWLLYVRGPPDKPDLSAIVSSVTVRLHHSYAPHHTVHIDKPPFHISRRGWGEFPAKVELHFAVPERNRPATVEHTIKLDRNYTGFQTLGAETVVDVWLYSSEDMLEYEFKECDDNIKIEPEEPLPDLKESIPETDGQTEIIFDNNVNDKQDNWLDFFSNATELDVDEMIIKPQKKVEDLENIIETNFIPKESSVENHILETDTQIIKQEPEDIDESNHWKDGNVNCNFKTEEDMPNELMNVQNSPKKRIMKYMDPTTGKIYYLEMDRKLDLTKVQEIIISSKGNVKTAKISPIKSNGLKNVRKNCKKGGVSLLKPEIKSLLKNESTAKVQQIALKKKYAHIENDHCYLGSVPCKDIPSTNNVNYFEEVTIKKEESVYDNLCSALVRLCSVKVAVDFCLKRIPLINSAVRDPEVMKCFPFVVETEEKYWKLDFTKRRNMEWSRAKLINRLLNEHLSTTETIWRTKQILIYARLHGYYPVRPDVHQPTANDTDWSSWTDLENRKFSINNPETYSSISETSTLTKFDPTEFTSNDPELLDLTESDEDIDVVKWEEKVKVKKEVLPDLSSDLPVLPVEDPQERLRFMFLEKTCADIGIELRNEHIGSGYSYSAVHAVLLSAARCFTDELLRAARAASHGEDHSVWHGPARPLVRAGDVVRGAGRAARLALLTAQALAAEQRTHEPL